MYVCTRRPALTRTPPLCLIPLAHSLAHLPVFFKLLSSPRFSPLLFYERIDWLCGVYRVFFAVGFETSSLSNRRCELKRNLLSPALSLLPVSYQPVLSLLLGSRNRSRAPPAVRCVGLRTCSIITLPLNTLEESDSSGCASPYLLSHTNSTTIEETLLPALVQTKNTVVSTGSCKLNRLSLVSHFFLSFDPARQTDGWRELNRDNNVQRLVPYATLEKERNETSEILISFRPT